MSKQTVKQTANNIIVNVDVFIVKDGKHYVAYCPALELSSYGKTEDEAEKAFTGHLDIFLEETHRKGTLERCLLKLGWVLQQKPEPSYKPPIPDYHKYQDIVRRNGKINTERFAMPV